MKFYRTTEVTGKFSNFLNIPEDVMAAATARGSQVHLAATSYAIGLWAPLPDEYMGYFLSFKNWFDEYVDTVLFVEKEFTDKTYGITGHPDLVLSLKGEITHSLCDLKTSASHSKLWRSQISAYWHLIEQSGVEIHRSFSLRLDANGGRPKLMEYSFSKDYDFSIFLSMLNVIRFMEENH